MSSISPCLPIVSSRLCLGLIAWGHRSRAFRSACSAPAPALRPRWLLRHGFPIVQGAKIAREFFRWSLEHGQQKAESLNYVPLPADLVRQIVGYWDAEFGG